jgi:hypothetical protein
MAGTVAVLMEANMQAISLTLGQEEGHILQLALFQQAHLHSTAGVDLQQGTGSSGAILMQQQQPGNKASHTMVVITATQCTPKVQRIPRTPCIMRTHLRSHLPFTILSTTLLELSAHHFHLTHPLVHTQCTNNSTSTSTTTSSNLSSLLSLLGPHLTTHRLQQQHQVQGRRADGARKR